MFAHAIDFMSALHYGATGWLWLAVGVLVLLSHILPLTQKVPPNTPVGFVVWVLGYGLKGLQFVVYKNPVTAALVTSIAGPKDPPRGNAPLSLLVLVGLSLCISACHNPIYKQTIDACKQQYGVATDQAIADAEKALTTLVENVVVLNVAALEAEGAAIAAKYGPVAWCIAKGLYLDWTQQAQASTPRILAIKHLVETPCVMQAGPTCPVKPVPQPAIP